MSIRQSTRAIAIIALGLNCLGGCSKVSVKSVERYDNAEDVDERDVNHPRYQEYVVGSVFFGAYIKGVNETTVAGGPPFSVNFGAYSLAPDSAQITLLAAEVSIQGRPRIDILKQFSTQLFDISTNPDQTRFDKYGLYGSEWLHTGQFLNAFPSNDEDLVVYFRIRVDNGSDVVEGELEFEFTPRVEDIPLFRLPL